MILKLLAFLTGVACFRAGQAHPIKTSGTQKEKSKGICMVGYPGKYDFLLFLRIHN